MCRKCSLIHMCSLTRICSLALCGVPGVSIYVYMCIYICTHTHTHRHTHTNTHVLTCACIYIHIYTYIHIHTYIHTYIHAYIHIHIAFVGVHTSAAYANHELFFTLSIPARRLETKEINSGKKKQFFTLSVPIPARRAQPAHLLDCLQLLESEESSIRWTCDKCGMTQV